METNLIRHGYYLTHNPLSLIAKQVHQPSVNSKSYVLGDLCRNLVEYRFIVLPNVNFETQLMPIILSYTITFMIDLRYSIGLRLRLCKFPDGPGFERQAFVY